MTDAPSLCLSTEQVAEAERLAEVTFEMFKTFTGNYPNRLPTHRLGKLGEVGVETWASDLGVDVDSAYEDIARLSEADVVIGGYRIEIKSWADWNWEAMGRCVRPDQVAKVQAKSDFVVWTRVVESSGSVTVVLEGWSTPAEIADAPVLETGPSRLRLDNHQVAMDQMHDMFELRDIVTRS